MVGSPKTLMDLRKVEGQIHTRCERCGAVSSLSREAVIEERFYDLKSVSWDAFCSDLRCRFCGSDRMTATISAFGREPEYRPRTARERLVFKAMCVLEEAIEQAQDGAVPPTTGLRFALAFLAKAAGRKNPELYAEFWRLAVDRDEPSGRGINQPLTGYYRSRDLHSHVNAIARAAGLTYTVSVQEAARRAMRRVRDNGTEAAICNLYGLKATRDEVIAYYQANDDFRREIEMEKDYVAPAKPGLVVREQDGQRVVDLMTWGWPNPRGGAPVVNVRNYSSPFWRSALANPERRCLVPFTRFQEWTVEPDPETGKKRPHWFSIPSRAIGTFAGVWRPSEKGPIFAFLTCGYGEEPDAATNHTVGRIHPKAIPVILDGEPEFDRWLHAPIEEALGLACAYPSQLITVD